MRACLISVTRVSLLASIVLLCVTPAYAKIGDPMPSIKDLVVVDAGQSVCEDGLEFGGVTFLPDEKTNPQNISMAFFKIDDTPKKIVPIAIVIDLAPEKVDLDALLVVVDFNRDGKIDLEGKPGDPIIGGGICEGVLQRVK